MSYISFQPDPVVHTYRYRAAHIDAPRMPQLVGQFPQIHIITYISKKLWRTNHRYHAIQVIQGGEDPYGALRCRSFIAKEPQIIGLFCGKRPVKIRHPMGLRHPVRSITHVSWVGRKDRRMRRLNSYVMFCKHMSLRTYPLNPSYWSSQSIVIYSVLHLECHFFILKSESMIWFSRSLLPRSVEKRPRRFKLEIKIQWYSKCNRLYLSSIWGGYDS